ncbi:hypothetical protein BDN70DRAFT_900687 [Pholiota conissans]|uniref:Uncharacterized protein n=1 Tax=Pholiota conissans TaxID=109636 RepID=A0A9P6CSM9_9AGAR|nr:hypothetical protein BDN70DRAFT_900687 [Pholiota conissans]
MTHPISKTTTAPASPSNVSSACQKSAESCTGVHELVESVELADATSSRNDPRSHLKTAQIANYTTLIQLSFLEGAHHRRRLPIRNATKGVIGDGKRGAPGTS